MVVGKWEKIKKIDVFTLEGCTGHSLVASGWKTGGRVMNGAF